MSDDASQCEVLLRGLVEKLDECLPHIANAFVLAAVHGARYDGPNYKAELDAAREYLAERRGRRQTA